MAAAEADFAVLSIDAQVHSRAGRRFDRDYVEGSTLVAPIPETGGGGGAAADTCTDSLPPQLWMLTTSRQAARWQDGVARDMQAGTDTTTGTAVPDWVYSTGFAVEEKPVVVKGFLVDSDGPVRMKTAKQTGAAGREFDAIPQPDQDEVWVPGSEARYQELRIEFAGANGVELRRAMVETQPIDAKGG